MRPGNRRLLLISVAIAMPVLAVLADVPPTAVADSYMTRMGRVLKVPEPGVLANDTDPEGGVIVPHLLRPPFGGTLTLRDNGSFVYTPRDGFEGYDQFQYEPHVGDRYGFPVTSFIRVNGRPDAVFDNYGMLAGQASLSVPAPGVLANDLDRGADPLHAQIAQPTSHGTVTLQEDGSFVYTPVAGYIGRDFFTYRAIDDGDFASSPGKVALRVVTTNAAPVGNEDTITVEEDVPLSLPAPGLLANDLDADGNRLQVVMEDIFVDGLTVHADGSLDFEPPINGDGDFYFTYRVTDGMTTSAPVTVRLDVQAVNDPPEVEGEQYETTRGTKLIVPAPGILANDFDPVEFDGVKAVGPITGPSHGTLHLESNGAFTYKPDAGFVGVDGFSYQVWDSQQGGTAFTEIDVHRR